MGIDVVERANRYGTPRKVGTGFHIQIDTAMLESMVDGIVEKIEDSVRPGAQAGAQILYDRVVENVDRMLGNRFLPRGVLRDAIYQAFKDKESGKLKAYYDVSWNKQKAQHGHLVEYGHILTYRVYFGKDGKYHTRVRPNLLEEWKSVTANGTKSVPQALRDKFYYRHPNPKQVAAKPFVREAISQFGAALKAAEDRFFDEVLSDQPGAKPNPELEAEPFK